MYHNIEKSGCNKGEYVGHGPNGTYRIYRTNQGRGPWWCSNINDRIDCFYARTLKDASVIIAEKLYNPTAR
jgi:hypothetical protein